MDGLAADCPTQASSQLEYTSFILAALTAGGGIMGFAKTGSLPSIIAGCSVGALCRKPLPTLPGRAMFVD